MGLLLTTNFGKICCIKISRIINYFLEGYNLTAETKLTLQIKFLQVHLFQIEFETF